MAVLRKNNNYFEIKKVNRKIEDVFCDFSSLFISISYSNNKCSVKKKRGFFLNEKEIDYIIKRIDLSLNNTSCFLLNSKNNDIIFYLEYNQKQNKYLLTITLENELSAYNNSKVIIKFNLEYNDLLKFNNDLKREFQLINNFKTSNINVNIYSLELENLFMDEIIKRGIILYKYNHIVNVQKEKSKYKIKIESENSEKIYNITFVLNNNILKEMSCDCPCNFNCKHEYAAINYLKNKAR